MDMDTALDRHTIISVFEAMSEIENHGHVTFVHDGVLWAAEKVGKNKPEQVCIVVNGQVHSRQVMRWLGY